MFKKVKKLVDKLKERIYYIVYEFISGQYGFCTALKDDIQNRRCRKRSTG